MRTTADFEYPIQAIHHTIFGASLDGKEAFYTLQPPDEQQTLASLPTVLCRLSLAAQCLNVTFVVQTLPPSIGIPNFSESLASHTDFLWEQNCLEIFLADNQSGYYEVNASFGGSFAIYEFDGYRNPATLPPKKTDAITFKWRNVDTGSALVYQFSLLFSPQAKFLVDDIALVNPCAIFYADTTPLFYAAHHACPPDFHDKKFWSNF